MKKCVPDPPAMCIIPGLSHEDAITKAADHLNKAIAAASCVPDPPSERHRNMLDTALLEMRISKALLTVALARSTVTVPI
ncbi:hypothetical protein [Pseudomonas japonica]|uniref:Uncharacterized protein n=1 Tax=Pseudomonas japonica TaxID=256466 RepID=A0A239JA54_9PSED|nr:hypothetical protein [Pseudomonas japonica]SNT02659.1 hypothetical protein SAMN05444352_12189 [Pseudomonas japonica]